MPSPDVIATLPQLCTAQDLVNRLSLQVLRQFCDDDRSGAADKPVVQQVIKDASSLVWSYIGDTYSIPAGSPVPDYLIFLTLNVAQSLVYQRAPTSNLGQMGVAMLQQAKNDLQRLASGQSKIVPPGGGTPTSTPPDASEADGVVVSTPIRGNGRGGHF